MKVNTTIGKILLWVSSYVSVLVFTLTGGYVWLKSDNEELKQETKKVLAIALIFVALDAIMLIWYTCYNLFELSYRPYSVATTLINLARLITYVVFIVMAIVKPSSTKEETTQAE